MALLRPSPTWTRRAPSGDRSAQHLVIVVDACVLANALADDEGDGKLPAVSCVLLVRPPPPISSTSRTVSVLRRRWLRRTLTDQRFATAVDHLQQLGFERVPTRQLMRRAFELRASVSAHDACYVALAEGLGCELITVDGRLSTATGPRCPIRVLR